MNYIVLHHELTTLIEEDIQPNHYDGEGCPEGYGEFGAAAVYGSWDLVLRLVFVEEADGNHCHYQYDEELEG